MKHLLLALLAIPAIAHAGFYGGAPTANPVFSGTLLFGTYHLEPAEYDNGTCATTSTVDWSNGSAQLVAVTGNCTFTFSNPVTGGSYLLRILQDSTGSRTYTWPAAVKWPGGSTPTGSGANKVDILNFYRSGSFYYGSSQLNY